MGKGHRMSTGTELAALSRELDELDLFPREPARPDLRAHRRWAFESAALDLALRQAGVSLGDALGREPAPVRVRRVLAAR
jgi:hypothetical protein